MPRKKQLPPTTSKFDEGLRLLIEEALADEFGDGLDDVDPEGVQAILDHVRNSDGRLIKDIVSRCVVLASRELEIDFDES